MSNFQCRFWGFELCSSHLLVFTSNFSHRADTSALTTIFYNLAQNHDHFLIIWQTLPIKPWSRLLFSWSHWPGFLLLFLNLIKFPSSYAQDTMKEASDSIDVCMNENALHRSLPCLFKCLSWVLIYCEVLFVVNLRPLIDWT